MMVAHAYEQEQSAAEAIAFNVAAATPAPILREARRRIDLLLETGASFREAETALRPLFVAQPSGRPE